MSAAAHYLQALAIVALLAGIVLGVRRLGGASAQARENIGGCGNCGGCERNAPTSSAEDS
ncbi:MAG TPA: hypothetical protein PLW13_09100 [Pseudomonadales bacterium]|jgi:hypothetical protein|nr:hypothetical protein [Pseudomonadales bacterium]